MLTAAPSLLAALPPQRFTSLPTGSEPIQTIDLASSSSWSASVDGKPVRQIRVPGGGYNSDLQEPPFIDGWQGVQSNVTYFRTFELPARQSPGAGGAFIEFGGVAHGAEVSGSVGGQPTKLLGRHFGAMMPFAVDVSSLWVSAPINVTLQVVAFHWRALQNDVPAGFIYEEAWQWKPPGAGWYSRNAFGITKFVRAAEYPVLAITDTVVHTSVTRQELTFELTVANHGTEPLSVDVSGSIAPWGATSNASACPPVPPTTVHVSARTTSSVAVGPIRWDLGNDSYWWPNKPFREVRSLHPTRALSTACAQGPLERCPPDAGRTTSPTCTS